MKNKLEYPAKLEAWWVREAERATGLRGEKALAALAAGVEKMSVRFTRERPGAFADYTSTAPDCAGYGVYFFPQTFARMTHVLGQLKNFATDAPLEILDVGSGTGAAGMAVARWSARHGGRANVTALDRSAAALETGQRLFEDCRELWPGAGWTRAAGDVAGFSPEKKYDMVACCFMLNELGDSTARLEATRRMAGWLKEDGVLVILEPAGEETSGALMEMRDTLAAEGAGIVAPCLHNQPCPMRGLVASRGFCHDVRKWRVPGSLEFVNRKLQRTVWDVKVSYLVVAGASCSQVDKQNFTIHLGAGCSRHFRVAAPVTRTKAHIVTRGCCADGTLRDLELQCRDAGKANLRAFDEWERGDLAFMEGERLLGDGRTWRVEKLQRVPFRGMNPNSAFG